MNFYREKNAKSIQNCLKFTPKTQKLGDFLINKLKEKANHIETIYNNELRYEYLKKKNKLEKAKDMTEKEIKTFLAKRLSIDMLQLYKDMLKYYLIDESNIQFNPVNLDFNLQELEYKNRLLVICEEIKNSEDKTNIFKNFWNIILGYISLYNFSFETIEKDRLKVEEKEGNFYNGLVVIYKD